MCSAAIRGGSPRWLSGPAPRSAPSYCGVELPDDLIYAKSPIDGDSVRKARAVRQHLLLRNPGPHGKDDIPSLNDFPGEDRIKFHFRPALIRKKSRRKYQDTFLRLFQSLFYRLTKMVTNPQRKFVIPDGTHQFRKSICNRTSNPLAEPQVRSSTFPRRSDPR